MSLHKNKIRSLSEKQLTSKSPLYGYRKPTEDDGKKWCNCTEPTLVSACDGIHQAFCRRCECHWYN
jgi:hypothetical protein